MGGKGTPTPNSEVRHGLGSNRACEVDPVTGNLAGKETQLFATEEVK